MESAKDIIIAIIILYYIILYYIILYYMFLIKHTCWTISVFTDA